MSTLPSKANDVYEGCQSFTGIETINKLLKQGGEAEPSEGCSYLTRVAPVVIKNDLSLK